MAMHEYKYKDAVSDLLSCYNELSGNVHAVLETLIDMEDDWALDLCRTVRHIQVDVDDAKRRVKRMQRKQRSKKNGFTRR